MKRKTIVALFEHRYDAVRAVRQLLAHGISRDRISLVSPTTVSDAGRIHLPLEDEDPERTHGSRAPDDGGMPPPRPSESVGDAGGIGSVLLGVAFMRLPAVGPVLAAGPLLAGAIDLPQRLSEIGMPSLDAERYARAVRRGGVLVVLVSSNEDVDDTALILARHRPVDPDVVREHSPGAATSAAWAG